MKLFGIRSRESERGQTIALVAISLFALLALAALAIDLTTLYVARTEAQRAADAAALAGAKLFVTSGFTSGLLGKPNSNSTQDIVCNSSGGVVGTGLAEQRAQAVAQQNIIAGTSATVQSTACDFTGASGQNPRITVTVQQTGLPTFFSRIWGVVPSAVSANATAEAFNPSGQTIPIQVGSVKPWGIPNCDPNNSSPQNTNCSGGSGPAAYFLDPGNNYAIANPDTVVGQVIDLNEIPPGTPQYQNGGTTAVLDFLALDILPATMSPLSCPSPSAAWGTCRGIDNTSPNYFDTIACANSTTYSCGQTLNVDPNSGTPPHSTLTQNATMCQTHATRRGYNPSGHGQDLFCDNAPNGPNCPHGSPIVIEGGTENPDASLRGVTSISRSDSVVTVPIWDLCPTGVSCPVTVVGFMQLGLVRVKNSGMIRTIVMNLAGCGDATGSVGTFGGGVAPIPVRLVRPGG